MHYKMENPKWSMLYQKPYIFMPSKSHFQRVKKSLKRSAHKIYS